MRRRPGAQTSGWSAISDVSPDGRHVLFLSNAHDLDGGGDGRSRLYVHDRAAATTTLLPVMPTATGSIAAETISNDGQRIGFAIEVTAPSSGPSYPTPHVVPAQQIGVAAVYDRSTGLTTTLWQSGTAAEALWVGPVDISANGRRVIWSRGGGHLVRVDFV